MPARNLKHGQLLRQHLALGSHTLTKYVLIAGVNSLSALNQVDAGLTLSIISSSAHLLIPKHGFTALRIPGFGGWARV